MDFELFAGFVSFAALLVVWVFAPKSPLDETVPAAAPALGKVPA